MGAGPERLEEQQCQSELKLKVLRDAILVGQDDAIHGRIRILSAGEVSDYQLGLGRITRA
jgi:hypothetical protein